MVGLETVPLGVEHFGQTGRIGELYRHFGPSVETIVQAVGELTPGARANRVVQIGLRS